MKLVLVALALVAAVAAVPVEVEPSVATVIEQTFNKELNGDYNYGFKSDDKIERQEEGEVKEVLDEEQKPHEVVVVRGFYKYFDKEGKEVKVEYWADETGFHAEGNVIPTVPVVVERK